MSSQISALQDALRAQIYVPSTPDFQQRAAALTILFATSLFLVCASLGLRVWMGHFWLFRRTNLGAGSFVQPHPLTTYLGFSACFLGLIFGYLEVDRRHRNFASSLQNEMVWRTIAFLPLYSSAWMMAWATAIAPLITRQPDTRVRFDPARYPLSINLYFISVIFGFYAACVPLILVLNYRYNTFYGLYVQLDAALSMASIGIQSGVFPDVAALTELKNEMFGLVPTIQSSWERFWTVLAVFIGILFLTFTVAFIAQFRVLRRMLQSLKTRELTGSMHRAQVRSVKRAYWAIIFTSSMMVLQTGTYLVIISLIATPNGLASNSSLSKVSLWPIAVLGLICNIVIFSRSFTAPGSPIASPTPALTNSVKMMSMNTSQGGFDFVGTRPRRSEGTERVHVVGFEGVDEYRGKRTAVEVSGRMV